MKIRSNWHSSLLTTSPKKLKSIAREMKNKKIIDVIALCSVSNKRICPQILKSIKCIANNASILYQKKQEEINNYTIAKAVVERKKIHKSGLRYKARGSASIARNRSSCLNIYLHKPKETIKNV